MNKYLLLICLLLSESVIYAQSSKSDSLFAQGVELYNTGKYKEALPLFAESDRIDKEELDSTSNRRDYSAMWLASCYYKIGDHKKAKDIDENFKFPPVDRRKTVLSDSLSKLGTIQYLRGDVTSALRLFTSCAEIEKKVVGSNHVWYANTLGVCASCFFAIKDSINALAYSKEVLNIVKANYGELSPNYISALKDIGTIYETFYFPNNIESSLNYYCTAIDLARSIGDVSVQETAYKISNLYIALWNANNKYANLESALSYVEMCDETNTNVINLKNFIFIKLSFCYCQESQELYRIGKVKEAIALQEKSIQLFDNIPNGKESEYYPLMLSLIASYYNGIGDYEHALQEEKNALELNEKILGANNIQYTNSLLNLAKYASHVGNNIDAINLIQKALTSQEPFTQTNFESKILLLDAIAQYYSNESEWQNAINHEGEAIELSKKVYGDEISRYILLLSRQAEYLAHLEKYKDAIAIEKECAMFYKATMGENNIDYATALSNLAYFYSCTDSLELAIFNEVKALDIRKNVVGTNHPHYAISVDALAGYRAEQGNYTESIKLETEALSIRKQSLGENHPAYIASLTSLAWFYHLSGDNVKALEIGKKALKLEESALGKNQKRYITNLNNIAIYNECVGNYADALMGGQEALNITKAIVGTQSQDYAQSLNNLAGYYNAIGDNVNAIKRQKESIGIISDILGNTNSKYAIFLGNLGGYYWANGNYPLAIKTLEESLKLREKLWGTNSPQYVETLNNLCNVYTYNGNYKQAIGCGQVALEGIERINGKEHPDYVITLNNLAYCLFLNGDLDKSINLTEEALTRGEKIWGKNHINYITISSHLADFYYASQNYTNFEKMCNEVNAIRTNYVKKNFSTLTSYERKQFWNKNRNWYKNTERYAYEHPTDTLISYALNNVLFSKGLLLHSERELSNLIDESDNTEIKTLYSQFLCEKRYLSQLLSLPKKELPDNIDFLEHRCDSLEKQLLYRSKSFGDFTNMLSIDWKTVKNKLKQTDVAIEFSSVDAGRNKIAYIAFVLMKDLAYPKLIPLFETEKIQQGNVYKSVELSNSIWKPLEEFLQRVKNIYFSPAGDFYNIAIENLPHWNGDGLIADKWNMFRLSSIRELVQRNEKNNFADASIFGGIKYDTSTALLVADRQQYRNYVRSLVLETMDSISPNLRNGVAYLPETKTEVETISSTLQKMKINTLLKTDTLATEGAFKSLSTLGINLMHIATHGFYWSEQESRYRTNLDFLMLGSQQTKYEEDKSLSRSGLLFAGANNALMGKKLPEGVDDGILTAKEISQLDLRGLDLVVLSACQTGLGEIKGDGVFGLQRGFKKAGANSLLMSLWKVDDEATRLLMTQFYKNLTSGMSKYESLKQAQKYVREYEVEVEEKSDVRPSVSVRAKEQAKQNVTKEKTIKKVKKYQDPYYWAAFILLDAIN